MFFNKKKNPLTRELEKPKANNFSSLVLKINNFFFNLLQSINKTTQFYSIKKNISRMSNY